MITNKYRPDIDGLRAIAVLAVVVYHFNSFGVIAKSGFIGVDVFFVISGYLITQILLSDLDSDNWIRRFYARRIRRIFPALILVIFTTFCIGALLLSPFEFKKLGEEIIGGSSFLSNIIYLQQTGYFDRLAGEKPLLHLWSLGIEEQFYILYPILIYLISRFRLSKTIVIGVFTLASFSYCQWISINNQNLSFYSPVSRAWELGIGGLFASLNLGKLPKYIKHSGNFGVLLLIFSFIAIDSERSWPGPLTVLPVVASLLILADTSQFSFKNKILSNRALVYLGKISYPLYLWHWPLWVFFPYLKGTPEKYEKIFLLVLSLLLASVTYQYLEIPIRKNGSIRRWAPKLSVAMLITLAGGTVLALSDGFPARIGKDMSIETSRQVSLQLSPIPFQDERCLRNFPNESASKYAWWFCRTSSDKPPTMLLLGNSFANQYYDGIIKEDLFRNQSVLSIGDCAIQREPELKKGNPCAGKLWREQRDFINDLILNTPSLKYIIVAGLKESTNSNDDQDLTDTLTFLNEQKLETVVFFPHLKPDKPITSCIDKPLRRASWDCLVPNSFRKKMNANFTKSLNIINSEFPNVLVFDPNEAFCEAKECKFIKNGIPLLRDSAPHISIEGSKLVAEEFANWARRNSLIRN